MLEKVVEFVPLCPGKLKAVDLRLINLLHLRFYRSTQVFF